jgi:hypothetical protein
MHPVTTKISELVHDADVRVAFAKADILDRLLGDLRTVVVREIGRDARAQLDAPPAFSPESLRAMEELAAGETAPTHDPLDTAPVAQPAVTTTPDPLDAPRPRRGGRRSRGSEGSPQPEAAPETTPQPEPQPDDLDLPGEPLSEPAVEAVAAPETGAAPAPEAAPSADPVAALFGTPGDDFDPLA